jgi:hypothetical protein
MLYYLPHSGLIFTLQFYMIRNIKLNISIRIHEGLHLIL